MNTKTAIDTPIRGLGRTLSTRIRLNKREHDAITQAADLSGISISSWARMVLRKAAAAELHAAGKDSGL